MIDKVNSFIRICAILMVLMLGFGMLASVCYVWVTQPDRPTDIMGLALLCAGILACSYPFVNKFKGRATFNGVEVDVTTIHEPLNVRTEERALKDMEKLPEANEVVEHLVTGFSKDALHDYPLNIGVDTLNEKLLENEEEEVLL